MPTTAIEDDQIRIGCAVMSSAGRVEATDADGVDGVDVADSDAAIFLGPGVKLGHIEGLPNGGAIIILTPASEGDTVPWPTGSTVLDTKLGLKAVIEEYLGADLYRVCHQYSGPPVVAHGADLDAA